MKSSFYKLEYFPVLTHLRTQFNVICICVYVDTMKTVVTCCIESSHFNMVIGRSALTDLSSACSVSWQFLCPTSATQLVYQQYVYCTVTVQYRLKFLHYSSGVGVKQAFRLVLCPKITCMCWMGAPRSQCH